MRRKITAEPPKWRPNHFRAKEHPKGPTSFSLPFCPFPFFNRKEPPPIISFCLRAIFAERSRPLLLDVPVCLPASCC